MPANPLHEIFRAKLASSGLTVAESKELGFQALDAKATKALSKNFEARAAFVIPYYDPVTGQALGAPPFYRIRYLVEPPAGAFGERPTKVIRYTNERGQRPYAYFPMLGSVTWPQVLSDIEAPLLITEGELKAACACKNGFPTIGLGGVDSFSSKRFNLELLPELEQIAWAGRRVYLVYDSDAAHKPEVRAALMRLGGTLGKRGALTFEVQLPDVLADGKTGLDDYLVARGAGALEELLEASHDEGREPLVNLEPLWALNDQYLHVHELDRFMDTDTHALHRYDGLARITQQVFCLAPTGKVLKSGASELKRGPVLKAWLDWPLHNQATRLIYAPGVDAEAGCRELSATVSADGPLNPVVSARRVFNVWPGWGTEPAAGDVDPFLKLVDHLFTGAPQAAKTWFLQWLAYPLQNPGVKMFTAAVIHGRAQGTGKSQIGYTMGKIYGRNYTEVGNKELHSAFNGWAARKQFVMGDEITGSDKRELVEEIKRMITQPTVRVNEKLEKPYDLRDCINYLFTSNRPNAFSLEDHDRRMFIQEVLVAPLPESFYRVEYGGWLNNGGPAALFDYLLQLDVSAFNPMAPAIVTEAKLKMIESSRSDVDSWVRQLADDPEAALRSSSAAVATLFDKRDLATPAEMLMLYDPEGRTRLKARGLGIALDGVLPKINGGNQIRGPAGKQYYYAIRNTEHWGAAGLDEIKAHLNGEALPARKVTPIKAKY